MTRNRHAALAGSVLVLLLAGCADPPPGDRHGAAARIEVTGQPCAPPAPNLVLFVSDALRAANLELYGYPRRIAPRLTALAQDSVVFQLHLVNHPGTPFSVSQLHTGRLLPPLLMDWTPGLPPVWEPAEDLLVLPAELAAAGYRTALISTHTWFNERSRLAGAFDEVTVPRTASQFGYEPFASVFPHVADFLESAASDQRPFFLYVHTMDTHKPYRKHPELDSWLDALSGSSDIDRYDSEIRYTDHWVGRIVDRMRELELLEETVVAFTSDHGEEFGELGEEWWNREHGATNTRAQLHVPWIVRLPRRCRAAGRWHGMTRHIDVAPTLLGLTLGSPPPGRVVDGLDLSPALLGGVEKPVPESLAFSHRYWSLSRGDEDLVYDLWEGGLELVRWTPDRRNYPRPEPIEDPARIEAEGRALARRARLGLRTLATMPRSRGPLAALEAGVSPWVEPSSPALPTFTESGDDDRWQLIPGYLLRLHAGESPPPLRLVWPTVPGTYRVWLRFGRSDPAAYQNSLTVRFLGEDAPPYRVDAGSGPGEADLGTHRLGGLLRLEFSEPRGGVLASGLLLDPEGRETPPEVLDDETEAQLRALGYVQ